VALSTELLERFLTHPWPGNVRELENLIKRIVVLESEDLVTQGLTGREAGLGSSNGAGGEEAAATPVAAELDLAPAEEAPRRAPAWTPGVGLKEVSRQAAQAAERIVMKQVLEEVRWNRTEAARRLEISYKALLYKIRLYELGPPRPAKTKERPQ
jgi:two-component system response regulator AtoC